MYQRRVLVRFPRDDPDDQQQRYAAGQIQQQHPHWLVMYGPHSRKIWAYPAFNVPAGTYFGEDNPSGRAHGIALESRCPYIVHRLSFIRRLSRPRETRQPTVPAE